MAAPDAPNLFDRDALSRMVAGNETLARSVITTFFEQADALFATTDAALAEGDTDTIINAFHKMGGSARTLGAVPLGSHCIAVERNLESDESLRPETIEDIAEAKELYRQTRAEMQRYLDEVADA